MKKILLLIILLCGAFIINACDKEPENEVKEDLGGETTGISAKDFQLGDEKKVTFKFVFSEDNEITQKDYNKVKKLGYKVTAGGQEKSFEVDFVKNVSSKEYLITIDDTYENSYNQEISVKLYYIFTNEQGNDKERYSNDVFSFSFYELAKVTSGEYAESILQKCEPDKVVRVDLVYNDEEFTIATSTPNCEAEIVSLSGKDVTLKVTTTKVFSENVRMYFNGKPSTGFVNNGSYIEYVTRTESVTAVDITFDAKEYQATCEENDLYDVYVLDELGSYYIKIIIALKDNNKLSPLATIKVNGEEVEVEEYQAGSYVVTFEEERITDLKVDFDLNTFEVENSYNKFDVVVGRDADFDDIEVKITAKDEYEFSKRVKIIINSYWYELVEECVTFTDKEIIVKIPDDRITKVYFDLFCWDLDPKDYAASTNATEYTVTFVPDKNLEYIYVNIVCNEGYTFSNDVMVYVNNSPVKTTLFKVISSTEIKFQMDDPNWTGIF